MEKDKLRLVCGCYSLNTVAKVIVNNNVDMLLRYEIFLKATANILRNKKFIPRLKQDNPVVDMLKNTWRLDLDTINKGLFIVMNLSTSNIGIVFHYGKNIEYNEDDLFAHYILLCDEMSKQYRSQFRPSEGLSQHPELTKMLNLSSIEKSTFLN